MASIVDDDPQILHGTLTLTSQVFAAQAGEGFHFGKLRGRVPYKLDFPFVMALVLTHADPGKRAVLHGARHAQFHRLLTQIRHVAALQSVLIRRKREQFEKHCCLPGREKTCSVLDAVPDKMGA
jgi:hypothetical protein